MSTKNVYTCIYRIRSDIRLLKYWYLIFFVDTTRKQRNSDGHSDGK